MFNPSSAGRLQAELFRLDKQTGTSGDICLEFTDSKAILLWVHMGSCEYPNVAMSQHIIHKLSTVTVSTGEGNGTPFQYFCLENSMDGGAWWAAVYGVAQSQTRLKRLSSSSSSSSNDYFALHHL